jgi:hypothetical protein
MPGNLHSRKFVPPPPQSNVVSVILPLHFVSLSLGFKGFNHITVAPKKRTSLALSYVVLLSKKKTQEENVLSRPYGNLLHLVH